jgi:hypothetical protein
MSKLTHFLNESQYRLVIKSLNECTKQELHDFYSLVLTGSEVTSVGLMNRIKEAKLLAMYYDSDKVVSVRAIKTPNISYKENIFAKAGVEELSMKYHYESGWSYTLPEYRKSGLSTILYKELLKRESHVYATTRTDNPAIIKILQDKLNFIKIGQPYRGNGNYTIQLWVSK